MKQELFDLLPELGEISDYELKEKTIKVWQEAIKRGSWKIKDLPKIPFTLLIENTSVNLIEHTRAVTICCSEIAVALEELYEGRVSINKDFLLAGALLHDVGKLLEYKKEKDTIVKSEEGKLLRHPISGAALAFSLGLPQEVIHIIAAHSKEGDGARRSVEAVIVNHSDFLNFDIFEL
jgi:putative nucleotidyltransferase with HDIG domain